MQREAVISDDGVYRYSLTREWGTEGGFVNFIMLNPSTADAQIDDPTIRRCIGFAKGWGFGGLIVTNLYAFRATDPKALDKAADPIGPFWVDSIINAAKDSRMIVFAWGNFGAQAMPRLIPIIEPFLGRVCHLGLTKTKQPKHPLYLSKKTIPILWTRPPGDTKEGKSERG